MDSNPGLSSCTNHTPEVIEKYTQDLKKLYSSTSESDSKESKEQNASLIKKYTSKLRNICSSIIN